MSILHRYSFLINLLQTQGKGGMDNVGGLYAWLWKGRIHREYGG